MTGCVCWRRWALVSVLLCAGAWLAAAAPSPSASPRQRPPVRGELAAGDVLNFADLAARGATNRVAKSQRKDWGRLHLSNRQNARSTPGQGTPGAGTSAASAQTPIAPTSAVDPIFTAAADPPSPPPSASFLALGDNAVAFNPDTQGAVGPNHLMVTLGSEVRIQNRSGGVISTVSLDAFWGTLGNSNVFDPRVIYDAANQRWITTAINNPATNNSHVLVAISHTSDPTGNWFRYGVRVDEVDGVYASSPGIGLSRDWIVVQANMQDQTGLFYFSSDVFVFNKTNLYAGGPVAFTRFNYFPAFTDGTKQEAGTPYPCVSFDESFPTNYLVANAGVIGGVGRLRLLSISGPVNAPVFNDVGFLVTAGAVFGNPTWVSEVPGNDNFAPQSGTTNKIFIGDARIQNAVYRNGAIWCTHHVFLTNGPARVSVQWWAFSPGGTVLQHGRMDDPTGARFFAYPSIAVNRYEDVLIGYSRFGSGQFPSANYAFHGYQDGPGRLQADTVLKAGEAKFTIQDDGLTLWGDWSGSVVDPLNDVDMWTIQEYAATPVGGIERWGTWWGRVSPPTSLGLMATGTPATVIAGSNVIYSVQVTNFSTHVATGIKLVSILPAGASFVAAGSSLGSCTHSNGVVTCDLGDVPGEVSSNVVVTATIEARLNQGGSATNRISVSGFGPDDTPLDNSVSVRTSVTTAADLALALTAAASPVAPSNNVTFSIVVTNRGPSAAAGVFVTNVLPGGMTFVSASASVGSCSQASGRVTCSLGTLATAASVSISIVARAGGSSVLSNSAVVVSSALDPNAANNSGLVVVKANAPPSLQAIANRSINEDSVLGPIPFTVDDAETPADSLLVQGFSSNPAVVPHASIAFSGSGANRLLTVTPLPNANGAVTITRTLADGDGWVVSNSFVLTINAVNDAPTISDVPDQTMAEDALLGPVSFQVGDAESAAGTLMVSGASSAPAIIPNANIIFSGSGASRAVLIRPATNASGSATITLTVSDGLLSVSDSFVVTVEPVNDLPTITDLGNRTINEDSSTPALSFAIGDVETPAASLSVSASSSNPALVGPAGFTFGGSGANRTVTVAPLANQFGSAVITVSVTDGSNATVSDTFNLTVNSVNDAPTLGPVLAQTLNEDAPLHTVTLVGISGGPTNEPQNVSITAVSSNPGLIPNPVTVSYSSPATNGTVSFAPTPNSNGTATITLTLNDGGASNSILTRVFNVTVLAVNDAPGIAGLADRTIAEDSATGPLAFTVGDVESAASALTVFARSSNTNLVSASGLVLGGSGSNRTVNVTPLPNQNGTATISIFVSDGAATNVGSFVLTVNAVNDLPGISSIGNRTVNEDTAAVVNFTVDDLETSPGSLMLTASSSNPGLVSGFVFGGVGGDRTLSITPAADQSGSATIFITVQDADGGSNTTSFALSVLPVNDPPTLDAIADRLLVEDAPRQVVPLSGISSGAANETQTLTVTAVSTNAGLLANLTVIYTSANATGRVELVPVPNAFGTAAVTVFVGDGQATNSRTFNVVIQPVNDPPMIATVAAAEGDEDVTTAVGLFVDDLETPAAQLTLQAVSSNPELLDESGIAFGGSGTNRTILLTPLPDASGVTTISITVADGSNEVVSASFEFTVRPINDPPVITGLVDLTIAEDSGPRVVNFVVDDVDSFPGDLVITAVSSNPALLPDTNLSLANAGGRTLTMTALTNQFGTSVVSVIARDGAGVGARATTNSFVLTVSAVNDPPTLDPVGSLVIPMNAGLQTVNFGGVSMGVSNEDQTLTVTAESDNETLIPALLVTYASPAAQGSLEFTPAPGGIGRAQITLTVTESGGVLTGGTNRTSRSFTVDVLGSGPPLLIEPVNGQAIISWPTNSPLSWRLETTTNLSDTASWTPVPGIPSILNGRHTVTNALGDSSRYYRLKTP